MGATETQLPEIELLEQAYREAFGQYRREAKRLAEINARTGYDAASAEAALLRMERARMAYNETRDSLAAMLMGADERRVFWAIPTASGVKDIAQLLWVMAGKPQGSADDDWYRAERVVRHAAAACCAR